jgi:predicted O-methyltransferase YrrM
MLKVFQWRPERPWLGFSAIRCIDHLLQPHWRLLEFGSGMSTVWFARRVSMIVSIETNAEWHRRVKTLLFHRGLTQRVESRLVPASLEGVSATLSREFDFALVDGETSRQVAVALAVAAVKPGGYVYLDNSDGLWAEYRAARQQLLEASHRGSKPRFFTDFCDGQIGVTQGLLVRTATLDRNEWR